MNYSEQFESFWAGYGQEEGLQAGEKGGKREAYKAWDKALHRWAAEEKKSGPGVEAEFARHVAVGHNINMRNRKALHRAKRFVPRLPMVATYLNQFRFEAELDVATGDIVDGQPAKAGRTCARCSEAMIGLDEQWKPVCKAHDLEDWYERIRKSTDERVIRWSPRSMVQRYPRAAGEAWKDWSRRVSSEIARQAKHGSALGALRQRIER